MDFDSNLRAGFYPVFLFPIFSHISINFISMYHNYDSVLRWLHQESLYVSLMVFLFRRMVRGLRWGPARARSGTLWIAWGGLAARWAACTWHRENWSPADVCAAMGGCPHRGSQHRGSSAGSGWRPLCPPFGEPIVDLLEDVVFCLFDEKLNVFCVHDEIFSIIILRNKNKFLYLHRYEPRLL